MPEPRPGRSAAAAEARLEQRLTLAALRQRAASLEASNAALAAEVAARGDALGRLDRQLRESEERLRLAQQHAGVGLWDWGIPSGTVSWSPECFALHGLDLLHGAPSRAAWIEAMVPEDRAGTDAA